MPYMYIAPYLREYHTEVASYAGFHLKYHIANSSQVKVAVTFNAAASVAVLKFQMRARALNSNYTR